jgi:hypothetical protein
MVVMWLISDNLWVKRRAQVADVNQSEALEENEIFKAMVVLSGKGANGGLGLDVYPLGGFSEHRRSASATSGSAFEIVLSQ